MFELTNMMKHWSNLERADTKSREEQQIALKRLYASTPLSMELVLTEQTTCPPQNPATLTGRMPPLVTPKWLLVTARGAGASLPRTARGEA